MDTVDKINIRDDLRMVFWVRGDMLDTYDKKRISDVLAIIQNFVQDRNNVDYNIPNLSTITRPGLSGLRRGMHSTTLILLSAGMDSLVSAVTMRPYKTCFRNDSIKFGFGILKIYVYLPDVKGGSLATRPQYRVNRNQITPPLPFLHDGFIGM